MLGFVLPRETMAVSTNNVSQILMLLPCESGLFQAPELKLAAGVTLYKAIESV